MFQTDYKLIKEIWTITQLDANPVTRVARLPRIRCLRSLDHCLIAEESKQ